MACLCSLSLLALMGCGSSPQSVSGRVLFEDGRPVNTGEIIFHLDEDHVFSAEIQDDGSFELEAPAGCYQVVIRGPDDDNPGIATVHYKYGDIETSYLSFEVLPGANTCEFRVKRGNPARPVREDDPDPNGDDD